MVNTVVDVGDEWGGGGGVKWKDHFRRVTEKERAWQIFHCQGGS